MKKISKFICLKAVKGFFQLAALISMLFGMFIYANLSDSIDRIICNKYILAISKNIIRIFKNNLLKNN